MTNLPPKFGSNLKIQLLLGGKLRNFYQQCSIKKPKKNQFDGQSNIDKVLAQILDSLFRFILSG